MTRVSGSGWYVLTGGPCAGKTSLLLELQKRGHRIVPEAARAYIEAETVKGKVLKDIRGDEVAFQCAVLSLKQQAEAQLPRGELIFFDRGIHDTIAYLRATGANIDSGTESRIVGSSSYMKAFLLDMLPFEHDGTRTESVEQAARIHHMLRTSYETHGVTVVTVPVAPLAKRAEFVLDNL